MKIKITRPDGTTIEAEGTAEECERIAREPWPQQMLQVPVYVPYHIAPYQPLVPWQPSITWSLPDGAFAGATSASTLTIGGAS